MSSNHISKEKNVFEAFAVGAVNMVKPVGCIIANLIAFRALFQFIDTSFEWFFSNVGLENFGLVVCNFVSILFCLN